jgi:hypothetical protein
MPLRGNTQSPSGRRRRREGPSGPSRQGRLRAARAVQGILTSGRLSRCDGREKIATALKDTPGRPGNGGVRLVGTAPLKGRRKAFGKRQYSPAPLAAFACRQLREKELGGQER